MVILATKFGGPTCLRVYPREEQKEYDIKFCELVMMLIRHITGEQRLDATAKHAAMHRASTAAVNSNYMMKKAKGPVAKTEPFLS